MLTILLLHDGDLNSLNETGEHFPSAAFFLCFSSSFRYDLNRGKTNFEATTKRAEGESTMLHGRGGQAMTPSGMWVGGCGGGIILIVWGNHAIPLLAAKLPVHLYLKGDTNFSQSIQSSNFT